jgi:hypothetical protein
LEVDFFALDFFPPALLVPLFLPDDDLGITGLRISPARQS